jgi:hypothetical protein
MEGYILRTNRPVDSTVGKALNSTDPWTAMLNVLRDNLDQGEGWAWNEDGGIRWLVGRTLLTVDLVNDRLVADIRVARTGPEALAPTGLLTQLNLAAGGWAWWIDDERCVHCSIVVPADVKEWWWLQLLYDQVGLMAAAAELAADDVAAVSAGHVIHATHPVRGHREQHDGWVDGLLLGSRDPSASLELFLTTLEYRRASDALAFLVGEDRAAVRLPLMLYAELRDDVSLILKRVWHPLFGWGWLRLALLEVDVSSDPVGLDLAQTLTARSCQNGSLNAVIGAWVWQPGLGLVQVGFVPALTAESITDHSEGGIGEVMALMTASPARQSAILDAAERVESEDGVREPPDRLDLVALAARIERLCSRGRPTSRRAEDG